MHSIRRLQPTRYARVLSFWARNLLSRTDLFPFYASFKVTSRCHFRCHFCDIWKNPHPDLSEEDVRRVLSNLGRSSVLLVSLEGGEPLMRPDIGEILKFARTQPFYILLTTSESRLSDYPMEEYGPYIDFFHVSIDEGHRNLDMFDELEEYKRWGSEVSVQTVVTGETLAELEWKVERCHKAGVTIVIMPAVDLDYDSDHYPAPGAFRESVTRLKELYPRTIITPAGFLDAINRPHGCSPASIIIRSDGALYYPCRVLDTTVGNLVESDLKDILRSEEAVEARKVMVECGRRCGWYQYFAIRSYTNPREAIPLLLEQIRHPPSPPRSGV